MSNSYFQFKQFKIEQGNCAMKVTTDGCLFGAWAANLIAQNYTTAKNTLDIGTGTGLLSLMLAQQITGNIRAVEIELAAAEQAAENFKQSPWSERLQVTQTDIKQFPVTGYDVIISNPPFYENDLRSEAGNKNLAHHDAGLLLQDLIAIIKQQLNNNSVFFLLLPYKRETEVLDFMQQEHLSAIQITNVKQTEKHSYFRTMIMGTHTKAGLLPVKNELAIRNSENDYTNEFTMLLQAYYLHL